MGGGGTKKKEKNKFFFKFAGAQDFWRGFPWENMGGGETVMGNLKKWGAGGLPPNPLKGEKKKTPKKNPIQEKKGGNQRFWAFDLALR